MFAIFRIYEAEYFLMEASNSFTGDFDLTEAKMFKWTILVLLR
jgi:hypothetical protein